MTTRAVLLIDFDNVFLTLWHADSETAQAFATSPADWLARLAESHLAAEKRRWLVKRCYLNPAGFAELAEGGELAKRLYFSRFRPALVQAGFEVVDCPSVTQSKNAADIRMVIDALDLLAGPTCYDEFVIASCDADFAPLLHRLRGHDRRVTMVSPGRAAPALISLADRVLGFEEVKALICADAPDARLTFGEYVRAQYAAAQAPLSLSGLAQRVIAIAPEAREGDWGGAGFVAAVRQLALPDACFSQHYLWDEKRHEPPIQSVPKAPG